MLEPGFKGIRDMNRLNSINSRRARNSQLCPLCNVELDRKELQFRSDDEAPTLVLSCPTHGVHCNLSKQHMDLLTSGQFVVLDSSPDRMLPLIGNFASQPDVDDEIVDTMEEERSTWVSAKMELTHDMRRWLPSEVRRRSFSSTVNGKIICGVEWCNHLLHKSMLNVDSTREHKQNFLTNAPPWWSNAVTNES
jgi:hypothetical protein